MQMTTKLVRPSEISGLRILLVDDHVVVRTGYRQLIEVRGRARVVAEAGDAEAAYLAYREHQPDLTIMDVMMPGASGIEAIRHIISFDTHARILVFSMYSNPSIARQALDAGASGILTKDSEPDEMLRAIDIVSRGERYLSESLVRELEPRMNNDRLAEFDRLSPREFEVCRLMLRGMRADQIAEELKISTKTVANLLSLSRQKIGVDNDIALAQRAARAGLIDWLDGQ